MVNARVLLPARPGILNELPGTKKKIKPSYPITLASAHGKLAEAQRPGRFSALRVVSLVAAVGTIVIVVIVIVDSQHLAERAAGRPLEVVLGEVAFPLLLVLFFFFQLRISCPSDQRRR